jgi:hypothetical protein
MFWIEDYTVSSKRCFTNTATLPIAGSNAEKEIFRQLQRDFKKQYEHIFPDKLALKTVVIIPSMTLDPDILSKIKGHVYYEERMLCMLMLLRMPKTHVVFVSSIPIDECIIDYYLHLLPGITGHNARQRLTMLSCYDASAQPLTQKILNRPRIINKIKNKIVDLQQAHMVCFNVAEPERTLAVQLGIPIYGCDPELLHLGNKSGSRLLFKNCGINLPDGYENLHTQKEIAEALYQLKIKNPCLRKAVIKINDGFSGEGNAIYNYQNVLPASNLKEAIEASLPYIHVVADKVNYEQYFKKFEELGGIVEEFLEGNVKCSPSVQCRINPMGEVAVISTHDQMLGGEDNQVFIGANFPASKQYAIEIAQLAETISANMVIQGVLGRYSIDFLSILENQVWVHYAIEINLRKGGTTHPFLMLQFLTDGIYDAVSGSYLMPVGEPRYYFASDNVSSPFYMGLTPSDLIEIATFHGIMYDSTKQEGVMFHLIGALSQYGKIGMICIGNSPERAKELYQKTIEILNLECVQIDPVAG